MQTLGAIATALNASLLHAGGVLVVVVVEALRMNLLLDSVHGDVCNSGVAVEDTGDLFQCGPLSLRIYEVDPNQFDGDPQLGNR
jgi:hypothetical protein